MKERLTCQSCGETSTDVERLADHDRVHRLCRICHAKAYETGHCLSRWPGTTPKTEQHRPWEEHLERSTRAEARRVMDGIPSAKPQATCKIIPAAMDLEECGRRLGKACDEIRPVADDLPTELAVSVGVMVKIGEKEVFARISLGQLLGGLGNFAYRAQLIGGGR